MFRIDSLVLVLLIAAVFAASGNGMQEKASEASSNALPAVKLMPAIEVTNKVATKTDDKKEKTETLPATHKQVGSFVPQHGGEKIKLHTFCLDTKGQILAVVGGKTTEAVFDDGKYQMKTTESPAFIQFYSHEQKLLDQIELDFTATAINIDKSGNIFVAGEGKILKMSPEGKKIKSIHSPSLKEEKELRNDITESLQKQYDEYVKNSEKQIELIEKKIKSIEEVDEEERSKRQVRQLKSFKQQVKMMADSREQMESFYKPTDERIEQSLQQAKEIKSIAVNDRDVYVTCAAPGTYGYEIWRVDKELENPQRVLENVSGCCGQMDIQARGEHLYVAENTKFQVAVYDRDGEQVSKFGSRATKGQAGFGSCCNPMNIRCCDNGEVLAAESSIGNIKRYNSDGELIGFIGRAKIGGGCKHVAIGHDLKRDIYYMMYQDEGSICVMKPADEAGITTAEKKAAEAAEGLGKKIVGEWEWVSDKKADEKKKDDKAEEEVDDNAPVSVDSLTAFKSLNFQEDGKLKYKLDNNLGFGWNLSFEPVKQEKNKLWLNLVDGEEIVMMTMVVNFEDDDQIEAEISFSSAPASKRKFKRKK